ncbi:MAG: Asp-tRNA(Asn)/Glu-tRNA(Gln) amidotransferase subunit GatC [Vicinamibacterales bacterium]
MTVRFTREDLDRVAALAHLELQEEEIELFARQLGDILEYAQQLQQIDTAGVEPTASVFVGHEGDRSDQPVPSLVRDEALANAPDGAPDAGLFRVPRVIG